MALRSQASDGTTIVAQATPPGLGGVGIVRLSGPLVVSIAETLLTFKPKPRYAHYGPIYDTSGHILDWGIALYFPGPHSFTGEDVLEFQCHGGPVILDQVLQSVLKLNTQMAQPGEFSKRAFLNGKMDLTQAEAVADLISAASTQAANSALASLQGVFSRKIQALVATLLRLRVYVEAALDFPDEEIDFLEDQAIYQQLSDVIDEIQSILQEANRGSVLKEGMKLVIAGKPNAGKSSLLNCLTGKDTAIVTPIAGTTRDVLREHIHLDGMPLHIIDTAGLRENPDEIEQQGIIKALAEIESADRVLLLVDSQESLADDIEQLWPHAIGVLPPIEKIILIHNKIDLIQQPPKIHKTTTGVFQILISAKTGQGLEYLRDHLKEIMGYTSSEGLFMARRRHVVTLERALNVLQQGETMLREHRAGELLAQDLRYAQDILGEITGEVTSDALLGEIFSSFCIGK